MALPNIAQSHALRALLIGGFLVMATGMMTPTRADDRYDHDRRWTEHQRAEQQAEVKAHHRGHWDHGYWDRDDDRAVEVYRPPAVYYAPAPPSGIDFVFRLGR